ncbi:hypothetical protein SLEP1_g2270 [Rubroshorea leprosula]|uniref:Uncharacterized protein n=1 Tax=Rubroshorea leprosula TaxID=152421 RepID=A0AAV5HQB5_9ROSI|nr:hypothetical protein SLEP1_g2270 [Rubroshorea leprosula]
MFRLNLLLVCQVFPLHPVHLPTMPHLHRVHSLAPNQPSTLSQSTSHLRPPHTSLFAKSIVVSPSLTATSHLRPPHTSLFAKSIVVSPSITATSLMTTPNPIASLPTGSPLPTPATKLPTTPSLLYSSTPTSKLTHHHPMVIHIEDGTKKMRLLPSMVSTVVSMPKPKTFAHAIKHFEWCKAMIE